MKRFKRSIAIFLCVVMTLTAAPLSGFVGLDLLSLFDFKADASMSIGFGNLDCEVRDNMLIAAGEGDIPDCASPSDVWWKSYTADIESAIIGNGITGIGNYVCYGFENMTSLTLCDSVERIGDYAFAGCAQLTDIYYTGTQEEWNNIEIGVGNDALSSAAVHFESTPSVTSVCGSGAVWVLDIADGELTVIGSGSVEYPWEDSGPSLDLNGYLLFVKSIVIEDDITDIPRYMFDDFKNLTSVTIGKDVTYIGQGAFEYCDNIENVYYAGTEERWTDFCIIDDDNEPLTSANIVFNYTMPDNSAWSGTYGDNVTWRLSNNGILVISGTGEMSGISETSTGQIIYERPEWHSLGEKIRTVIIKDGITTIAGKAFCYASNLTLVMLPESLVSIGSSAFNDCTGLEYVMYKGSYSKWNEINIGDYNEPLTAAGVSCFGWDDEYPDRPTTGAPPARPTTTAPDATQPPVRPTTTAPTTTVPTTAKPTTTAPTTTVPTTAKPTTTAPVVETTTKAPEPEEETTVPTPSYDYSGTCGNNLTWTLNKSTGVLNISGTGAMTNWSSYSTPWYSYRSYIKTVNIGNSVTSIGNYAFRYCYNLTSVTIGNSITSIGSYAFYNCTSLTSVTIPDSVTSIGDYAFYDCSSLTSVTIGNSVTTIGDFAFYDCDSLTSVTIPDSVTSIGERALYFCDSLTSVTIPDSVTSIGDYAFSYCDSLTSITVSASNKYYSSDSYGVLFNKGKTKLIQYPIGNTRTSYLVPDSVTTIGNSAFASCDSITSVTIPDSVTSIGERAFGNCYGLTSVTIPDSVTTIGNYAFVYCDSLTSVTIPDSVTTIGNDAFSYCDSLTSVTIPDSVTSIGSYAFYYCDSLTDVYYSGTQEQWKKISIGSNNSPLTSATIHYNYETVMSGTCGDNLIWSLDTSTGVLNITGTGEMYNWSDYSSAPWYSYRSYIKSVNIGNSVTTIGERAFYDCYSLTSITIPDSVTTIGNRAFGWCDSLASATIGNSVTSIGDCAFYKCDSLTSVTIGNSVTSIGNYAFWYCGSLTSATIGNSVTTIGERVFEDCDSLTSIKVDADNKYYSSDSYGVLFNKDKTNLIQYPTGNTRTSYTIPDSVTTIGEYAFSCSGNNIAELSIENYSFGSFHNITSITIPDSVTTIGNWAFCDCDSLTDVYYTGTEVQWNKISIGFSNEDLTSATIHYNYVIPSEFIYSQSHVVGNYKDTNADYAAKYFAAMAQPMDGTNGNPDLCIPGLSLGDNMVPQGVAYYEAKNWLLISAYYNSGNTNTTRPSVIFALDMATGKMVGEYHIYKSEKDENGNEKPYTGHVGGIAVSDYNLYIAYGKKIAYVPLSDLENTWRLVIKDTVGFSDYLDQANVSYLSINDGVLLFGNFYYAYSSDYKKPAKDAKSVILMQRLRGNSSEEEWNSVCNPAVTAVIKVPDSVDRIQGVVCRDNKFFISSSQGRDKSSTLYTADLSGSTLKNIRKFQAPPMMEGLTFAGDYIYIVFESAAAFYREGLDGEGKSVNPTDVVWRLNYNEWLGIDDTPTVTGDVENKYVQYVNGGTTGYTYLNFKQNWFAQDSINYNHSIGQLCSQFAMLGYDTPVKDPNKITGHDYTKPNLKTALEAIGMSDVEIAGDTGETEVNTFIAHRSINVNGEEYSLVFAGFIGSNYAQWYNNFDPGTGATHNGFLSAKTYGYGLLEAYIQRHGFDRSKTKILITGHSRGAATANLVAAQLIKDEKYATAGNIFTYAFATPNSTTLPERNEQRFKRIFNIVNPEDFVTKVIPTAWGYGRYGTTYVLPSKTNTTSSLYSAYLTNMQRYFYDFTGGGEYHPFKKGEKATHDVVKSLTSVVHNTAGLYEEKFEWLGKLTSIQQFFLKTLCAYVGERKGSPKIDEAKNLMIKTFSLRFNSSKTILDITDYFVGNEGIGGATDGVISEQYFTNAHQAETYCAYMLAMSETQIKQTRKGYENTVNCPVDIEVIDKVTGEVVGRIVNNVVDEEIAAKENAIVMSVDGDSKSFWLPSDGDYEVKLIGNDEGTMDYTVAEIDPDLGEQERVNFFDVEITEGKEFTGDVPAYDFEIDEYTLKTDSSEEVPDEKLDAESGEITITTSVEGDGYVTESFNVKSGDYVTVSAQPFVTAKFVKWVDSSGNTLSTDAEYSFVAKENTSIKAVFTTASGLNIQNPSTTTVNYGDILVLEAVCENLPDGYSIVWECDSDAFAMSYDEFGTCYAESVASGTAIVTARVVDENGEAVLDADGNEIVDTIELVSRAGFFQRLISFFKNLFGLDRRKY